MANPKNIHYNPNGPLPDCDCDEVDDCWICKERHYLSFFKKCDECGHNRMYWENQEDDYIDPCWKCVMCPCCGDGPASTGEVCVSSECVIDRALTLKDGDTAFKCECCDQLKKVKDCDIVAYGSEAWCDVCFHEHRKYLAETEGSK